MNLEIIANNEVSLSLTDNVNVSLNFAIQDILDLKKRKTNFSKTIVLQGDDINNTFFENIFDVNISTLTFNPRIKIPVVLKDDLNILMTGSLNLISIENINDNITYNVAIIGELSNIHKELKGKTIDFLDLSEFDHIRNKQNIIDSWNNTEGYIYPHIIYGNKDAIYNQFFVYDMQPALYVKTIFDKMINALGYTYDSVFLNTEYFKSLVLTSNNEKILKSDAAIQDQTGFVGVDGQDGSVASLYTYNFVSNLTPMGAISTSISYPFNRETPYIAPITGINYDFTDISNQSLYNTGMSISNTGYYNIKVNFNAYLRFEQTAQLYNNVVNDSGGHVYTRMSVMLQRNDGSESELYFSNDLITLNVIGFGGGIPNISTVDQQSKQEMIELIQNIFLEQGETIVIKTYLDVNEINFVDGTDPSVNVPISINYVLFDEDPFDVINTVSRIELIPTNQSLGNEEISLNSSFNLKLDNLFSDIVKMFNLVIIEDDNNNLIIDTYDNYFNSKHVIKDWTDLVDRNKLITILPLNKLDYNKYQLEYSQGKDWLNDRYNTVYDENYGTKIIDIKNDFSKKTEVLKLNLEATPNSNQFMNQRSVPFLCDIVDEVTNWQFKQKKTNSRMLFIKRNVQCDEWFLRDVAGDNTTSFIDYTYVGMLDHPVTPKHSLSFGTNKEEYNLLLQSVPTNTLVNEFHRNKIENIINIDSRLMTLYLNLSNLDIKEFDFRDIIFIDGSYWRVDNIADYNPLNDGVTKVTLYKLLDDLTLANINLSLDGNIQSCPNDITISNNLYISKDTISRECCTAIGGLWNNTNNTCMVQQNISDNDTISDKPPVINKGNLTQKNGNTILSPGSTIVGTGNYVGVGASPTGIFGNNNTVNDFVTNVFITGNNNNASNSNTIYVQNILISGSIDGIDISWNDLVILHNNANLVENALYNIIDKNIRLWTLDNNTYNPLATLFANVVITRFYNTPITEVIGARTYFTHQIFDNVTSNVLTEINLGNPTFHYVIYNGVMWKLDSTTITYPVNMNTLGVPGISNNWIEIMETDIIYPYFMIDKGFVIYYNLLEDKIYSQIDNRGNQLNATDSDLSITDWGCDRITNNRCAAISNNYGLNNPIVKITDNANNGEILNNKCKNIILNTNNGDIKFNIVGDSISNNTNNGDINENLISLNTTYSPNGIEFNSNNGNIFKNTTQQIQGNSCWDIKENVCLKITANSNIGTIFDNTVDRWIISNSNNGAVDSNTSFFIRNNSNNGPIVGNIISNGDSINLNSNGGAIILNECEELSNNNCAGLIRDNILTGVVGFNKIQGNMNAGDIRYNTCFGINNNVNAGGIFNNSCERIEDNSNNGGIYLNINGGYITENGNVGAIYENDMTNGNIERNSNNGFIFRNHCQSHIFNNINGGNILNVPNTFHLVHHNTNNGLINGSNSVGLFITDPIVNK